MGSVPQMLEDSSHNGRREEEIARERDGAKVDRKKRGTTYYRSLLLYHMRGASRT